MCTVRTIIGVILAAGVLFAQDERGAGDSIRGRAVFEGKGGCLTCHRVGDKGSRMGPGLTTIGSVRSPDALIKSVVDPKPEVQPQNRVFRVVTRDGAIFTGKLLNQDTSSLQMLDSTEKLRGFPKANVREYGFVASPPMPSYRDKLGTAELTDLMAYLSSLKDLSQ